MIGRILNKNGRYCYIPLPHRMLYTDTESYDTLATEKCKCKLICMNHDLFREDQRMILAENGLYRRKRLSNTETKNGLIFDLCC